MDSVSIDRLQFSLLANAVPQRAALLLAHLREVAAERLPQALASRATDAGAAGYLFIERLHFDCPLNAAWSDDRLAQALAQKLSTALAAGATQGAGAIAFRDRAEYLAALLIALADGSAWRQWYFSEFDGLKPLSVSGALRTVLTAEGDDGRAALGRLTEDAARRVLQSLSGADAGRLLEHLLASLPGGGAAPPLATLLQLREAARAATLSGTVRHLAWLVALIRAAPAHANAAGLDALAWLEGLLHAASAGHLNEALARGLPPSALLAACCHAAGLGGAPTMAWSDADCAGLLARLHALAPPGPAAAADNASERFHCPHGGAWLLLVQLVRLEWWERWQSRLQAAAPEHADALAARLVLAVIARAAGGAASAAIEADPALRRALGIDDAPGAPPWTRGRRRLLARTLARPERVAAAPRQRPHPEQAPPLERITAFERALQRIALDLLQAFAARVPGCDASSADYLRRQCLALDADVVVQEARIDVHLGRAPLDVLLTLAGLKRSSVQLPGGRTLSLQPERAT